MTRPEARWPLMALAGALALAATAATTPSLAENIFERTGEALGGVARSTGDAIGTVAKGTGEAVGEVACGIGEGAKHIANPNAPDTCGDQTVVLPDDRNPNVNPSASTDQTR